MLLTNILHTVGYHLNILYFSSVGVIQRWKNGQVYFVIMFENALEIVIKLLDKSQSLPNRLN